jgi:aryl-alcohol dehydrogenase-like predicted oxidoreductase
VNHRTLGRTDLSVSVVSMGCWAIVGDETWGPQDERASIATIHAALDSGVTTFDTAEAYGQGYSEEVLGRALAGRRHEAVIATKVSGRNLSAAAVRQACERSLRLLQTDTIDLYQIHWPSRVTPLAETLAALEELRQEGKVRAVGVCNFGPGDLTDLLALGWAETNQLPYSLLWRAIEHEIRESCVAAGMGILCYSPLAQGLLTGKFATAAEVPDGRARTRLFSGGRALARHGQAGREEEAFAAIARIQQISAEVGQPMPQVALAWLLHQPGVTSVIAGARRPEQIRETARAAGLALSPEVVQALTEATEPLKQSLGPDPDMWQAESRFR